MQSPSPNETLSILSPKDKPLSMHKGVACQVVDMLQGSIHDKLAQRMSNCATNIWFQRWLNRGTGEIKYTVDSIWLCRSRHDPVCTMYRNRVWRARLLEGITKLKADHPSTRFILLTLTIRNCPVSFLKVTLQLMSKSFDKMLKRTKVKKVVLGYVRSTEITRSEDNEAHPHFHVLLAVRSSYFSHGYLTQADWAELWQQSLGISYTPVVDVRTIKPNKKHTNDTTGVLSGVLEVVKYCVKSSDMLLDADWLIELVTQLDKTRQISLGGLIKDYCGDREPDENDALKLKDDDGEDLEPLEKVLFRFVKEFSEYQLVRTQ